MRGRKGLITIPSNAGSFAAASVLLEPGNPAIGFVSFIFWVCFFFTFFYFAL